MPNYHLTFGYSPPQPVQHPPSIAPESLGSAPYGNTRGPLSPAMQAMLRSAWPQESWSSQTGGNVASQLATMWVTPTVFQRRVFSYTLKDWPTQKLIGGGLAATLGTPSAIQVPAPNVAANAAVRGLWPEPQWSAQAEMTVASVFATVALAPASGPYPQPGLQVGVRSTWPVEEWRGQSESAIAAGLSQILPPPVLVPSQVQFAAIVAGGALWPRETWNAQTATHSLAWLPAPITAIPNPVPHTERGLWPQEQWSAQSGAVVASRLATVQQQIPPLNAGLLANIQSSWPREQWAAQSGANIAGLLAPVKPPTFVNNPPIQPAVLQTIASSWPAEAWSAQFGARVASQFSQAPAYVPLPVSQVIQYQWPREDWKAQASAPVAALFAQQQTPPLFNPRTTVAFQAALVSAWPQDSWSAQSAPPRAAWIPPLVTATPAPPLHTERLSWPQEQWPAQIGATIAARLATATEPQPASPPQQSLVSIWPQPSWDAQSAATVASQLALVFEVPFVPGPVRAESVAAWPQEAWSAQRPAMVAGQLVATPVPITPVQPSALGTIRSLWPQEDWTSQKGARGASSFAKAPPVVPFISIPTRAQLIESWPREEWKSQTAPRGAYIFANIGPPPPPPPPPNRGPHTPANLGYKVTTRTFNLLEMVTRQWGGELRQPDHRVYEFSNGRAFDSTDMNQTGIYRKK